MGVNRTVVNLSTLARNNNLRLCPTVELPKTKHSQVKLIDCLKSFESGKRPEGGIVYFEDEDFALSLGGEQIGVNGTIDLSKMPVIPLSFYNSTAKGKVLNGDILVCKDGALTGKVCVVSDIFPIKEVMVNEHVYIFRGNGRINQKVLFYLIRSPFVQLQIKDLAYRKKGQPGLNSDHLSKIRIPDLDSNLQNQLLTQIESIEYSMDKLKASKRNYSQLINDVFSAYFKIDIEELSLTDNRKK